MRRPIAHQFVEFIPKERDEATLYISIPYSTAVHNCLCGCGMKVVTPIKPTGWQFTYNGENITLYPSVGNWSFACRSHYWIRNGTAIDAGPMTEAEVSRGRARDSARRDTFLFGTQTPSHPQEQETPPSMPEKKQGFWGWLLGK